MCYVLELKTGDIITLTQFEEGDLFSETRNNTKSGDGNSIITLLLSEYDMDDMESGDESYHDLISMETLEDIHDISQSHLIVNQRESCYKIRDRIRQRQSEWKVALR